MAMLVLGFIPCEKGDVSMSDTDDRTQAFLRWADNRQVTIGFVNQLDEPPVEVWRFKLEDVKLSADDVAGELLRFTQELEEEDAYFSLDVTRHYRVWGRDTAAFEVALMISSVVLSHIAGPVIESKIEKLRKRMGDESPTYPTIESRSGHKSCEISGSSELPREA
jgi:hypothetical protein